MNPPSNEAGAEVFGLEQKGPLGSKYPEGSLPIFIYPSTWDGLGTTCFPSREPVFC